MKRLTALVAAVGLLASGGAGAQIPPEPMVPHDTLSDPDAQVRWEGRFTDAFSPSVPEACAAFGCHERRVTLALPGDVWDEEPGGLQVTIRWATESQDLDLFVYGPEGDLAARSDGFFGSTGESVLIPAAPNGTYRIVVSARYAEDLPYEGVAMVERFPAADPPRDLLPNLVSLPSRQVALATGAYLFDPGVPGEAASCYPEETIEQGAQKCLRFDQIVANVGEGPLEVRVRLDEATGDQRITQRIYRSDGTVRDRDADTYEVHLTHAHTHYPNFARSHLWASNEAGDQLDDAPVRSGRKNGFCLIDVEPIWFGEQGDGPRTFRFPNCNLPQDGGSDSLEMVMGISVGWADVYWWYLADQYIEISGVPDGYYLLETVANPPAPGHPDGTIEEVDRAGNTATVLIRLCGNHAEIAGPETAC